MLAKEAVAARLDSRAGISYTEFSYLLLQALRLPRAVPAATAARCRSAAATSGATSPPASTSSAGSRARRVHALAHAADHQGRRHEVRQDRGRHRLARPGADLAVRLLPVLAQRRRPRRRRATCGASRSASARGDRGARGGDRRAARGPRGASARWPSELTTLVHGADGARRASMAASQALFGRGELARARRRRRSRPRWREAGRSTSTPASRRRRSSTCSWRPAWSPSKGAARRAVAEGGAYLNNVRVDRRRTRCRPPPTCCTAGGSCCAGASARSPASSSRREPADRAARRIAGRPTALTADGRRAAEAGRFDASRSAAA